MKRVSSFAVLFLVAALSALYPAEERPADPEAGPEASPVETAVEEDTLREGSGWNASRLAAARRTIARFFAALARRDFAEAAIHLHPEADRSGFLLLSRTLKSLELLSIRAPSFHPDGRSVFYPVILRTVMEKGAPAGWETGIITLYVRLRLVNGEPRLAEIAEGP